MIHTFRRRRRLPEPVPRLAVALVVVLVLLLAGCGLSLAQAQEVEAGERYTPSSRGNRPAVTQWRPLLEQYGDWDVAEGLRVIDCESSGDPDAVNPTSGAAGLLQLYGWGWLAERLFGTRDVRIPWVNVAVAHVLWLDGGGRFGWYDALGRPRGHWGASIGCWSW